MKEFAVAGILEYDPQMLGNRYNQHWLIVNFEPDIGKYYRHLYHLSTYRTAKLETPAWKEHITVIRNEKVPDTTHWRRYNGMSVEVAVKPPATTNGHYVWLPVDCKFLLDLREELGLPREPIFPLHLSIGHL